VFRDYATSRLNRLIVRSVPIADVRSTVLLFLITCLLGGLGGAIGSMVGHAAGQTGLWIGGIVGGVLGSVGAVAVARHRRWLSPAQFPTAAAGASIGFLLAAAIAVNTLGSPIGPVLSTTLIGVGALVGARARQATDSRTDHPS
jgi:hypothetical protein